MNDQANSSERWVVPYHAPYASAEQLDAIERVLLRLDFSPQSLASQVASRNLTGSDGMFALLVFVGKIDDVGNPIPGTPQGALEFVASRARVDRISIVVPESKTFDLDIHSPHFIRKHLHLSEYTDPDDMLLCLEEEAKYWRSATWQSDSLKRHLCAFSIRCPDRPGILLSISKIIESWQGRVSLMQQSVHGGNATILTAALFIDKNAGPSVLSLLKTTLGNDAIIEAVDPDDDSRLITTRVVFVATLVIRPRGTKGVFKVFANERMSISECEYRAGNYPNGTAHLRIVLNSAGASDSLLVLLLDRVRSKAGVISAEFSKHEGSWLI